MPDGRCVVVDSCIENGQNVVVGLLTHLRRREIDLLVVTHADLDHADGLADIISAFNVRRAWRYPGAGTLVDLLPRLIALNPRDLRLRRLGASLDALDLLQTRNRVHDVGMETRAWPPGTSDFSVNAIAPTPKDVGAFRRALQGELVELGHTGRPQLGRNLRDYLLGKRRRLAPGSNPLSVALSVEWRRTRLILGGDVEHPTDPERGWSGLLAILREDGRTSLVENASLVKAPHHGSNNAYCDTAWLQHAQARPVKFAIVTPFGRGAHSPPHSLALSKIARHALNLGTTARPRTVLPGSGWRTRGTAPAATALRAASCVIVEFLANGTSTATVAGSARMFTP